MFFSSRLRSKKNQGKEAKCFRPLVEELESRVVPSFADGNGPVVTGLTSVPGSTQLVVTFDGPLNASMPLDPAEDIRNYQVAAAPSNPELVSVTGPLDPVIAATYSDNSASQVTLTLKTPLKVGVTYRIVINGTPAAMSVNTLSNPLTDTNGVLFDGDNDETPGGDFYGLFAVGTKSVFSDSNLDRVTLSVTGGGSLNVWRELDGDINQVSVVGGKAAQSTLHGSVVRAKGSTGTVYVGAVTFPVPSPITLNGATDALPGAFVTVTSELTPPAPVPTAASPTPVQATSQNLPYALSIIPVSTLAATALPGLQSAVYAQEPPSSSYPAGLWVIFGGRTNGLHNFTTSGITNFPPDFQNEDIFVVNPVNWQIWSLSWSQTNVPVAVYNSLSSADQEFYQQGDTLYTVGGYSVPDTINFTGTTTNNSATITDVSDTTGLAVGQFVSGTGVPLDNAQNVTITAIGTNTITLSQPATASATGVALTASTDNFTTYDTLTALSVKGLINAVINGGNLGLQANIKQISDPRFAVTGGGLSVLNGRTYLVFGQAFQGGYIPFTTAPPSFTQIYTDEVQSFRIVNQGNTLAITAYTAVRDPINFRRRDGNMGQSMINGQNGLTYYGGVFSPGEQDTGYEAPIQINVAGQIHVVAGYQQYFSQYTTANIPLYDARDRAMDTLFLGGISNYYYANGVLTLAPPGRPGPPWVDNVTAFVEGPGGADQEYSLPALPGFYGANAAFLMNPALPIYANGNINLDALTGPTILGYMYGGIFSTVANTSDDPSVQATQTGASNQVFLVILTPIPKPSPVQKLSVSSRVHGF